MKAADIDWGPGWNTAGYNYTGVYNLGRLDCVVIRLGCDFGTVTAYDHRNSAIERRVPLLQAVVLAQMTPGEVRAWLLRKEAEGANG